MATIKRLSSSDPDFSSLVRLLDVELTEIDDSLDHQFYGQFNQISSIKHAIVLYENSTNDDQLNHIPIGCGAIRQLPDDSSVMEIKRMYIKPAYRRHGYGLLILEALELWSKELGYKSCILETGKMMFKAIGLYLKSGYVVIPNYGQYIHDQNSVCMKKELSDEDVKS